MWFRNSTYYIPDGFLQEITHDLSVEDWARLQRYTSWVRELYLGFGIPSVNTLFRLLCGSPNGLLFPNLESLFWHLHPVDTTPSFFHLFLSPHLWRVGFYDSLGSWDPSLDQVAVVIQIISTLLASLEDLDVVCGEGKERSLRALKAALHTFICQCVPQIRGFGARVPLSEAATLRLLRLPNLSCWRTSSEPPQVVSTPILPSLNQFCLDEGNALSWLHFLAMHGKGVPLRGSASATLHTNASKTLKAISPPTSITDSVLLSSIMDFWNLVTLELVTCCRDSNCQFCLMDDDVEILAIALPRLKSLQLGETCSYNTCTTTIVSLMSISIHCLDIITLQTHFNTKNIIGDIEHLFNGGAGHDKVKCKVRDLFVEKLPLRVDAEGMKTVAVVLQVIFPHLTHLTITGSSPRWSKLTTQMGLRYYPQDHSCDVFL